MDGARLTLEFRYTKKDYRPFLFRVRFKACIQKALFMFFALFVVYIAASRYIDHRLPDGARAAAMIYLFAVPLAAAAINWYAIEKQLEAMVGRTGNIKLEFDENGVSQFEENKTSRLLWPAYKNAVEDKDKFLLTTGVGGLLIPKRIFDSHEKVQLFRSLIADGLKRPIENR